MGEVDDWQEGRSDFVLGAAKEHERGVGLFVPQALDKEGGLDWFDRFGCPPPL